MNVKVTDGFRGVRLADDCNDKEIWPPYESFYIHAMLFNARSAVASIQRINTSLEQISRDELGDTFAHLDKRSMLCELQNIVLQAATLSRYFWPVRQGHEARARQLRAAFDVTDDNPLKARDLRNEIEHFDERLDAYLHGGIAGHIFPEFVGPLPQNDDVPTHIFRAYYVDAGLFEMLGKRYEIEPLAHEMLRMYDRLLLADRNGGHLGGS